MAGCLQAKFFRERKKATEPAELRKRYRANLLRRMNETNFFHLHTAKLGYVKQGDFFQARRLMLL